MLANLFGCLGFLMQGGALIGIPIYVVFFGGSSWWFMAVMPIGFAGMVPLSIMHSLAQKDQKK